MSLISNLWGALKSHLYDAIQTNVACLSKGSTKLSLPDWNRWGFLWSKMRNGSSLFWWWHSPYIQVNWSLDLLKLYAGVRPAWALRTNACYNCLGDPSSFQQNQESSKEACERCASRLVPLYNHLPVCKEGILALSQEWRLLDSNLIWRITCGPGW